MDLSGIIVVIVLSAAFVGFIVWLNIHSRKSSAEQISAETPEVELNKK